MQVKALHRTLGLTFGLETTLSMTIAVRPLCRQTAERMRAHAALTVDILLCMSPSGINVPALMLLGHLSAFASVTAATRADPLTSVHQSEQADRNPHT